jgi:hypothetical protein
MVHAALKSSSSRSDGCVRDEVGATEGRPGVVRTLEGVGHLVPIEAPGAVAEGIAEIVTAFRSA